MKRILLLLEHRENRRLLCEWLKPGYDVIVPDWDAETVNELLLSQPFDLCIIGARALDQLWETVQARRTAEQPVLLPFLLTTSRQDVKYVTRQLWQSIDELITQPIEKAELQARIEILLRSRQLSLQLQTANQKLEQQITARQQAETKRDRAIEAQHDSEDRFRQMAETIQSAFWLLDRQTQQMLYLSPAYEQIWGRSRDDLYANPTLWIETIHPDDRDRVRATTEQCLVCDSHDHEYRIVRPDGSTRWVRDRSFVVRDSEGHPYRLAGVAEDITDRKQTEVALQRSEQRYRDLAEAMPQVVWLMDAKGAMQYFNQQWYEYTGLSEAESMGFGGMGCVHPEDRERTLKSWTHAIAAGESDAIEYRLRRSDGVYRWFISRGVPLRDSTGQITSWIGTITDIDHQKRIEAALREREGQLQFVLDSSQIGEWELDLTSQPHISRRSLLHDQIFGYKSLLPEWSYETFLHHVHPDDRAAVDRRFQQTLSTYNDLNVECRIIRADRRLGWIWKRGSMYRNAEGEPTRLVGIVTDITERKRAEAALQQSELNFRTLADSMPQLFWTTRADGYHDYFNQRWYEYTGMSPEQTQGWGWSHLLHPDDQQRCLDVWNACLQTGEDYNIEYRFRQAKNGQYRWFLGRAIPLKDHTGRITKWFGSCTDIHDQRSALEERDRALEREQIARAEAESANRIKDEFLAVLSHELRSPLNPILGWTRLLRSRKFDEVATDRALETIERNAKIQTQLIEDLLDISRILNGKLSLTVHSVDVSPIIQAALETVRLAAEAKSIQIHTRLTTAQVLGDASRLQQVIWNLLSNAIKFTPAGGRVDIRLERVGTQAQLQVSDTGKGIKPEFLPYVFETFRQADGTTTRTFGGLGLGLAIA
ncbi:PAS domain-containing protein, partial [Leptolyngbya sp. FACHB-36]|uniref:hybrid sensor histidine kinase/response regulator n=1 Tax=Leptolyngbya sp. FACHB-36 TaxID=2692808 RepID=UPI00167FF04C